MEATSLMHRAHNHGSEQTVAVATTSGLFLGANPNRVALTISSPKAKEVTISAQDPAVLGAGLTLQPGTDPAQLTLETVGDWLQRNLFAIADTSAETLGIVEVLCPCRDQPLTP